MILKNMLRKILKFLVLLFLMLIIFLLSISFYVSSFSWKNYLKNIKNLPKTEFWLVFWASVNRNQTPSSVLADRLEMAFRAYKDKKIEKIVVSGYASNDWYNEPKVMKSYLISLWVSKDDIYLDEKWEDTYESIYQFSKNFKNKKVVLFTQDFQLKRAIYIASKFSLKTYWVETNLRKYYFINYFREVFARVKAVFEVEVLRG